MTSCTPDPHWALAQVIVFLAGCIFSRMVVLAMAILMGLELVDCDTVKV